MQEAELQRQRQVEEQAKFIEEQKRIALLKLQQAPYSCSFSVFGDTHIAIQSECSKEVILSLLEANTDAAKESDRDGYFPLPLAIHNGLSDDITLPIVKANKEAVTKNCDCGLPLHMAIHSKCSNNVILAMLAACKEAVKVSNGNGSFPLHLCVEFKLSSEITLAILAESKDATKVKDQFGKLPLYNAIENGLSADIILSLLTANESATKVKDGKWHTTASESNRA